MITKERLVEKRSSSGNPGVEEDPEIDEDELLEVEEGGLEVFDEADPDGTPSSDQNICLRGGPGESNLS